MFRRNGIWYTSFTFDGKQVRESTRTRDRRQAEEYEARLKARLYDEKYLGKCTQVWEDAVLLYLQVKAGNKSLDTDRERLRWLRPFLDGKNLADIDGAVLSRIVRASASTIVKQTGQPRSAATTNRYLQTVKKVLTVSVRYGNLRRMPSIPSLAEPDWDGRFLTRDEAQSLLQELRGPRRRHIYDAVRFSLATGLREANVAGLRWRQVEPGLVWVPPVSSKSRRPIRVPLNDSAQDVLKSRRGSHPVFVFTYAGKRVQKLNADAFKEAKRRAGLPWLRWHDLRHTWASWHIQAGTPLAVLKELGGWSSMKMVERYAHLGESHIDQFTQNADLEFRPLLKVVR